MRLLTLLLLSSTIMSAADSRIPPQFPRIAGDYRMTEEWMLTLPKEYARRVEDGSLVLWRKGVTCWSNVWNRKEGDTPKGILQWLKKDIPKETKQRWEAIDSLPYRFAYLLQEKEEGSTRWALYCFVVGEESHVQMAIYFDDVADLDEARSIYASVRPPKKKEPNQTSEPTAPSGRGSP